MLRVGRELIRVRVWKIRREKERVEKRVMMIIAGRWSSRQRPLTTTATNESWLWCPFDFWLGGIWWGPRKRCEMTRMTPVEKM